MLGGDKDDTADGKDGEKSSPTASEKSSTEPSASAAADDPRGGEGDRRPDLGSHGALVAAVFAVLGTGGDGGDVTLVAAARTLPLMLFLCA